MRRDPSVPLSRNNHLLRWVEKMKRADPSGARALGRRLAGGERRAHRPDAASRARCCGSTRRPGPAATTRAPTRAMSPASSSARSSARSRKTPPARRTTGMNPYEMRRKLKDLFNGAMRGPDDVRPAVQHGDRRLADVAGRRPADRLAVRRRQHADHGADRAAGVRGDRPRRAARRAVHAQRRRAARRRASRTCPGRATTTSTSSTSRRRARSGRTARATAATRCSARSASACGSPRTSRATTAGWPSTC